MSGCGQYQTALSSRNWESGANRETPRKTCGTSRFCTASGLTGQLLQRFLVDPAVIVGASSIVHLLQQVGPVGDLPCQLGELIPVSVTRQRALGLGIEIGELDIFAPEASFQLIEVLKHVLGELFVVLELQRVVGAYDVIDVLPGKLSIQPTRTTVAIKRFEKVRTFHDFPRQPGVLVLVRMACQRAFSLGFQTLWRNVRRVFRIVEYLEVVQQLLGQLIMAAF